MTSEFSAHLLILIIHLFIPNMYIVLVQGCLLGSTPEPDELGFRWIKVQTVGGPPEPQLGS